MLRCVLENNYEKVGHGMQERVTLKTIAELANTSVGTVDRALKNKGRISKETKEKILKIAEELDYKPNAIASALGKHKQYRIGIVMASEPVEFCNHLRHGLEDALEEVGNLGVTGELIMTQTLSSEHQLAAVKSLDMKKYDAFLVNAGSKCIGEWIDLAVDAGKSVATFNTDIEDSKRAFYVGEDPYNAGLLIGNLIGAILPEASDIALLMGFVGNDSHQKRCQGVKDAILSLNPNVHFQEEEYFDDAEIAEEKTEGILKRSDKVDALFAASGTGAWGIGNAVSKMKAEDRPKVFGYDVSLKLAELMESNICQGAIFQDPYWQGYYGLKILTDILVYGQKPARSKYGIRPKLVLKCNVRDYLKDKKEYDGFLI